MASRRDALPPSNDALSSSFDVLSSSCFTVSPSRDEESKHRVALAAPPSTLLSSEQAQPSSPAMAPSFVEPASPPTLFPDSDDDASIHAEMEIDISHEDNTDKNDSKSKKSGNNFVPKEGMTFASLEEFESLYYSFAVSEGYTVRIRRTTKFSHTDRIRYRQYVCSCAGFCEEKKTNDGLDVLVFDTTYKTNKYGLPLGNFVGVNNHTQSIMFGFALLQNEQEETFVWLFETWLHAVGGKLPVSILTDQDRAIENAIRKVFPTVSHRFCLWHITNKFPEKFGSLYKENSPFGRDMKKCLYNSVTTEQFDNAWNEIMEDYKLTENEWLNNLFEIRQSWVPVYNHTIFYAGMNTTQRCESIHSFFDSFLNKGTTLREFVVKYEHALEHRYRAEHVERFASIYKAPILQLKSPLEKQAAEVYTRNIFNLFQVELIESLKLQNDKLEKSGSSRMYKVSSFLNNSDEFVVIFDVETREVFCECHLFEFKGILCRHALTIFNKKKVANVPSKYILPRWTKKAGEGISIPLFKKDEDKSSMVSDLKFSNMMSRLRAYLHVNTNSCDIIMEGLDGLLERVSNLKLEENQEVNKSATIEVGCVKNSVELPSISNPLIAKTKGRTKEDIGVSKNGRFKRGFEVRMENSKKSKRQCKSCGQYGHYSSTCERRKRADVMEEAHTES